jgi:2-methylcitrate dehydratase
MKKSTGKTSSKPDQLLVDIAQYVSRQKVGTANTRKLARYCLMDALGCVLQALDTPELAKMLGPLVPGTLVPNGARVPGTQFQLDPVTATFNITCLVRWHDYNDMWRTGGHPSDNFGSLLAMADHLSRTRIAAGRKSLAMADFLTALIKAYEINGVMFDGHTFNRPEIGLDTVLVPKLATAAVVAQMMGGTPDEVIAALSNAVIDGHSLHIYRTEANAGPRKSWAAGDATARGVWLAMMAMRGEPGYPRAFTAKTWGFQDVLYCGDRIDMPRRFGSSVMDNIMFKVPFPAQRNTHTALECAIRLHPLVRDRLDEIERIELRTHARALNYNSMKGPLHNFAARDHCMEYIVTLGLLDAGARNESYTDAYYYSHPQLDRVRSRIVTVEDPRYTRDYKNPALLSNHNSLQVFFKDGSKTPKVDVEFPAGHPRRRSEGLPMVEKKFRDNIAKRLPERQARHIAALLSDQRKLEATPVNEFMDMLVV